MVSFVNPYILNSLPGPSGADVSYLYAQISNQAGNVAANGIFEPTLGTTDYAGPTGATTETSNKITVQAGDDGDYIGIANFVYEVENGGSQYAYARFYNSSSVNIAVGGKSERVVSNTTGYGRSLGSYNVEALVDGDYAEFEGFLTNTAGAENYGNGTSLSLVQPGGLLAAIRLSANQVSAVDNDTIQFDEFISGYSDAADLVSHNITINENGWYLVVGQVASSSSGAICGMTITGSSTGELVSCAEHSSVGSGNKGQSAVALVQLQKGETVSATLNLASTADIAAQNTMLAIWRIRDADVLAVLGRGSDYSVPNSVSQNQNIPLDSVIEGSGSLVTANSGALTIQETGWYLPIFSADMSRGSASTCLVGPAVRNTTAGGLGAQYGFEIEQAAGTAYARSGMKPLYCTAGDIVRMTIYTINGQPTVTLKSSVNTRLSLIKLTGST